MMGATWTESARVLNVSWEGSVVVVGGGIAGIAAALAAARNGADVLLLEREYSLGGMATLGLVTIYLPLDDGMGNQVIFGLGEELLRESIRHGAEANYPSAWLNNGTLEERKKQRFVAQFNPHLFALRAERLLRDQGVRILYGTLVAAVCREGQRISALVVENKSGRSVITCKSVIDCTGDADVVAQAGGPTALHGGGNGLASWYYYATGGQVKLKMFGLADIIPPSVKDGTSNGDPYDNVKVAALTATRFSGVNGEELSAAVLEAHEKMYEDILRFKEATPDYVPVTMSSIPLVRMSRRLVGAYELDDTEQGKHFEDSIGLTGDWRCAGPCYELPYRCLMTPTLQNLLVAGRDISVTDAMWDITRVIPPCAVTGEAAGTAAALTSDFVSLDVCCLQERLEKGGARLHI